MKRAAYISSWIALVLYGGLAVVAFMSRSVALPYSIIAVAVVGLTLVAFHAERVKLLPIVAAVLNGVFALLVFVMVAGGINFAVGLGAFITAAVFLALFFVPALLNVIAMRGLIRRVSGAKTTQDANYPVP